MAKRPAIPKLAEAEVLTRCHRRCCLCVYLSGRNEVRKGQIAHLNQDPKDNRVDNLAYLCLEHHDEFDSQTSQSKGLTPAEVRHFRDLLHESYARVAESSLTNTEKFKPHRISPQSAGRATQPQGPRSMPVAWGEAPDAATIEAVRRRITDWDGENREAIYQWLRNHNRTHDEIFDMDWFAVRMAFGTAIKLSERAETNAPSTVAYPAPANLPIPSAPPTLRQLYDSDFSSTHNLHGELGVGTNPGETKYKIPYKIAADFPARTKFIAFFVPPIPDAFGICRFLADQFHERVRDPEKSFSIQSGRAGEATRTDLKELTFSGRVYVYHEDFLPLSQLAELESLFRTKGAGVIFRGHDYLVSRWHNSPHTA